MNSESRHRPDLADGGAVELIADGPWLIDDFLGEQDGSYDRLSQSLDVILADLQTRGGGRLGVLGDRPEVDYEERYPLGRSARSRDEALAIALDCFEGVLRLHSSDMLFNASPPPSLDAAALVAATSAYDPNALWDEMSGGFLRAELRVLRFLGELAGWEPSSVAGAFTYGGKATLAYGVLQGMRSAWPDYDRSGAAGASRVLVSERVHFSLESACSMHGVGSDNCVRLAEREGRLDLDDLRRVLSEALTAGVRVPVVVLTGGAIIDCLPDPIAEVSGIVDEAVERFDLDYRPMIHIDAVVTWPWLALGHRARLSGIAASEPVAVRRSLKLAELLSELSFADSFGVDFHKLGAVPNVSSCFVTRRADCYYSTGAEARPGRRHGTFRPYLNTFENTRPCTGIVSAYYTLLRLGVNGLADHALGLANNRAILENAAAERTDTLGVVINHRSLGVDLVIRPFLGLDPAIVSSLGTAPQRARLEWAQRCDMFYRWLMAGGARSAPVLGYVARYTDKLPALLMAPTRPGLDTATASDIIRRVEDAAADWISLGADGPRWSDELWAGERPVPPR